MLSLFSLRACRYLEANPGDIQFFPKFEKVSLGHLLYNADFQAQTLVVMEFLSQVVNKLGNITEAGNMLKDRVRTHKPRSISMAQFEVRKTNSSTALATFFIYLLLLIVLRGHIWKTF